MEAVVLLALLALAWSVSYTPVPAEVLAAVDHLIDYLDRPVRVRAVGSGPDAISVSAGVITVVPHRLRTLLDGLVGYERGAALLYLVAHEAAHDDELLDDQVEEFAADRAAGAVLVSAMFTSAEVQAGLEVLFRDQAVTVSHGDPADRIAEVLAGMQATV